MLAYLRYRRLQHACGQPLDVSSRDEMAGGYETRVGTCYACQALHDDAKAHNDSENLESYQWRYVVQTWDPETRSPIQVD